MNKVKIYERLQAIKTFIKPFKWYISFYILYFLILIKEYFYPPAKDDQIWSAQETMSAWNYQNQELYLESIKIDIGISILIFLLALSNMQNYPRLAKLILLYPWFMALWNIIEYEYM